MVAGQGAPLKAGHPGALCGHGTVLRHDRWRVAGGRWRDEGDLV